MNVRATRTVADPSKAAVAGTDSYQAMVASMKEVDGFLGALLLVDRTSGAGLSLTFWENEAKLRGSEEIAGKFRRDSASALGATTPPTIERFEVAFYGVPEPTKVG